MDAVTAAKDLQELGVNYTQEQLDRIKRAEEQRLRQRRMEREAKERERLAALYDPKTDVPPDVAKIEFVLSMLDKLIGENGHLQPEDRSLIAASLKNIYKPLIASGYTAPCPTLGDLYRDLNKSDLRRAKQLALMLDVFANGSLQAFSKWFGDGSGTPDDSLASPADVTTPDGGQNVLWRWQSGRPAPPDCHDVPAGVHQYAGDDQPPQGRHGGYMDLL